MSILLDDREDSHLADQLARFGLPVTVARLDFGDLAIQSSEGLLIGYERKKLTDLINCMKDRRLSGYQLTGMRRLYDRVEVIVEGIWRPGDDGSIEVPKRDKDGKTKWLPLYHLGSNFSYRQVDSYLYSQYEMAGVGVWRTGSVSETAHLYASRWHWWQKDYDLHKSHDVIFSNDPTAQRRGAVTVQNGNPGPVTLVAAQVPGIDAKAWDLAKQFKSVRDMVTASEIDWRRTTWTDRKGNVKRFGPATARKIVEWFRGDKQK